MGLAREIRKAFNKLCLAMNRVRFTLLSPSSDCVIIDHVNNRVIAKEPGRVATVSQFDDLSAFYAISQDFVNISWFNQYYATFTWLGFPLLQYPDDLIRFQEIIWRVKPDVIIETGVFKGGSMIFLASMCRLLGRGRVIGVDITIDDDTRNAIKQHSLGGEDGLITLYEGSSTDEALVAKIRETIKPDDKVLVILDSDHSKKHVARELEVYCEFVSNNSFMVVCDGVMRHLAGRGADAPARWGEDNPFEAAKEFAAQHKDSFEWCEPEWPAGSTSLSPIAKKYEQYKVKKSSKGDYVTMHITQSPGAYLRKL